MSTKKNLETTFQDIEKAVQNIDLASLKQIAGVLPENLDGRAQKLVQIYNGIKPLLTVVSTLPIFSPAWRSALSIFTQAIEALVAAPDLAGADGVDFKAGKDV